MRSRTSTTTPPSSSRTNKVTRSPSSWAKALPTIPATRASGLTEGHILVLDQDIADFGADTQFARAEGRASYYYPFTPSWVLNVAGRTATLSAWAKMSACSTVFPGRRRFGASSSQASPRTRRPGTRSAVSSYIQGPSSNAFPLGLPEELRIFGRGFVEAGSLSDPDVSGPTVFDSRLRASAGGGLSWLSPSARSPST